jgi:tRNA(Ile)-lysidine synthase TilS/MesJ
LRIRLSLPQNIAMKKAYPSREKDRWEHALTRPLKGVKFEMLELMRIDLFEYLDVLTTCPYDDDESNDSRARDLRRVARRLAELTPRRARAARAALKAGRLEFAWQAEERARRSRKSAPMIGPTWELAQRYWERAQQ